MRVKGIESEANFTGTFQAQTCGLMCILLILPSHLGTVAGQVVRGCHHMGFGVHRDRGLGRIYPP